MAQPPSQRKLSWIEAVNHDLPASIVVFLVALPLCMGVAIASGAPVAAGLITGIVGGIVVGLLAGSPLQVSGPAAGLTVIVYQFIQNQGIERLGMVVLAAGALQLLAGLCKLGQWFRAVSPAVIHGMLAGIGVLIFASQFHVMVDDKPKKNGLLNLVTIPEAIRKGFPLPLKLGTAEERAARTRQLKDLGALHLTQLELDEEVRHLLTDDERHPSKMTDVLESGAPEAAPPAIEHATPEIATAAAESEDPRLAAALRALVPRQAAVLESLRAFDGESGNEFWQQSLVAAERAQDALEAGHPGPARAAVDGATEALARLLGSVKSHPLAAALGVLTILTLLAWQSFARYRLKVLPSAVVAVALATLLAWKLNLPVLYVEVPDNLLAEVFLPSLAELRTILEPTMMLAAVQIAVIASAETLLCASAVDQLHNGPRTQYDRELAAQGVGNMICGLLSALPMTGVIVRSGANVRAGARTRLSSMLHGVWLLIFVAGLAFVLRMIPTASLAAILVYTGWKLVNPKAVKALLPYGKSEVAIFLATMGMIVLTDLLTGVLTGLGLSVLKLLYNFSHLDMVVEGDEINKRTTIRLKGAATFLRLPKLATALERVSPGTDLHVKLERLSYIDHACLDLLMNWEKQHEATGGTLTIDWDSLEARFGRAQHTTSPRERQSGPNGEMPRSAAESTAGTQPN
jgi:MFS superfamily sulfate permease-like transporter